VPTYTITIFRTVVVSVNSVKFVKISHFIVLCVHCIFVPVCCTLCVCNILNENEIEQVLKFHQRCNLSQCIRLVITNC